MRESKEQQLFFMRWAIQLGERGRRTTPPNPWVGCVIVNHGHIIAEGYHEKVGERHAEIIALERAGVQARGATAYVSLEPCAHHGKTPPCVAALVNAGIQHVVIAIQDPDPQVSGRGIAALKEAGIDVTVGIGSEEAELSLKPYLHQRRHGQVYCVMKAAISLDGRIAAANGSSQWITGEEARQDVHRLRAESQAIIVGAKTALHDFPKLTVRIDQRHHQQPLRVILDRNGNVPPIGPLADLSLAPTLMITSSLKHQEAWQKCGAEVICQESITLKEIMQELAKRKIIQALVEGGGHLQGAFLKEGLINHVVIYLGACLLGDGLALLPNLSIHSIEQAVRWSLEGVHRFGNDIRLDYSPSPPG